MSDFDRLFDDSNLPYVLKQAKTLSKEECRAIYDYMSEYKPKVILEFGVQFGCSTAMFLECSRWLNLDIDLHSWDIIDVVKSNCVNKSDFTFHLEDVTGLEDSIVESYNPDLLFLDAHPYYLTKALMLSCLKRKINFMTHDIEISLYESVRDRSDNFAKKDTYGAWELYILAELFSDKLLTEDFYEDDNVIVKCYRNKHGLSVIEHKI